VSTPKGEDPSGFRTSTELIPAGEELPLGSTPKGVLTPKGENPSGFRFEKSKPSNLKGEYSSEQASLNFQGLVQKISILRNKVP